MILSTLSRLFEPKYDGFRGRVYLTQQLAGRLRRLEAHGLTEVPSTRLLVTTARLIAAGISPRDACRAAMAAPLTDEPELLAAMEALVTATF